MPDPPSRSCPVARGHSIPSYKQAEIASVLVEGCSIRAVERLTGVHRDTIMRLGVAAGGGCHALNDRLMRGLNVGCVELDEIWSYVGKKQKRLSTTVS